ncbi:hypothetical protein GCM10022409_19090 [Hymenobacter glaciei]|uniref:Uncharacterized protein n=1 Tax=Hymenobacter glaciei TaxID=877209 RepID=A0ABP7U4H7_9BACT
MPPPIFGTPQPPPCQQQRRKRGRVLPGLVVPGLVVPVGFGEVRVVLGGRGLRLRLRFK